MAATGVLAEAPLQRRRPGRRHDPRFRPARHRRGRQPGPGWSGRPDPRLPRGDKGILEGLGASLADVVQTRVFLTDFDTYADYNEAYREFFTPPFPTRATLGTSELALGAGIEIEAVAIRRA